MKLPWKAQVIIYKNYIIVADSHGTGPVSVE